MALTKVTLGGAAGAAPFSPDNLPRLSAAGTANYAVPQVIPAGGDKPINFRSGGPVFPISSSDRIYSAARIPVRNVVGGEVLQFNVVKVVAGGYVEVIKTLTTTLAAGQTEMVVPGPIVLPAGERCGVFFGFQTDGWSTYLDRFYGSSSQAFPETVDVFITDNVTPLVDAQQYALQVTAGFSGNRTFYLDGANAPKGVQGKLAPADYIRAGATADRGVSPVLGELYFDTTLAKVIVWNGAAWSLAGLKGDPGARGVATLERSFQAAGTLRIGFTSACTLSAPTVFHNGTTAPTLSYAKSVGMAGAQSACVFPQALAAGDVLHISLSNMVDATDVSVAFDLS